MSERRTKNAAVELAASILEAQSNEDPALAAKQARLLAILAQQAEQAAAVGRAEASASGRDVPIEPGPPSEN